MFYSTPGSSSTSSEPNEDMLEHQGVRLDRMDFLHEPFTLEALSKRIRDILDRW
jgi:hypothetical protein